MNDGNKKEHYASATKKKIKKYKGYTKTHGKNGRKIFWATACSCSGKFISDIINHCLPENGIGAHETLDFLETNYANKINNSATAIMRFYHWWVNTRRFGW